MPGGAEGHPLGGVRHVRRPVRIGGQKGFEIDEVFGSGLLADAIKHSGFPDSSGNDLHGLTSPCGHLR